MRLLFAALLTMACLGIPRSAPAHPPPPLTLTGSVEFRAIEQLPQEPWYRAIPGARILVIAPDGKLLTTGLTDAAGRWTARVTVPADLRFAPSRNLGTVTAIAIASGYVERLFFDVPVTEEGAVQVVTLNPIQPHQRNEPGYELGMLHRLWVLPLLDHYAQEAGLGRQTPVAGDWNAPHWAP